jgi:ArsR family transcriptional regulator, arsenate/arsenite/antimonite-responsive transcriptional repressor
MDEELLTALKALADASRLTIVGLLAKRPHSVDELAAALGLSAPTVSHHLSKLAQAGLVEVRSEQYYNVYSLKPQALDGIGKRVMGADRDVTLTALTDEAAYERAAIKEFVRPNGVTHWPTGLQKQRAILRWLGATKFQRSLRYSEPQVEDILSQSIYSRPDTNSLRRYMISEKVLVRTANGSWYWRADTPEAQHAKFSFEQLAVAEHQFSPEHFAQQLKGRRKLSFTREALDARLRELGVRDIDVMRASMIQRELLLSSEDGSQWTITDPWKMQVARTIEVKKRFLIKGNIPALPHDPADRLLVLRWLADNLNRYATYDDVQLARIWHHAYADVPALKRLLLDEGLLVAVKDGRFALPDVHADS